MYKKITLEKFERIDFCRLADYQIEFLKKELEYHIDVLNRAIEDGYNYLEYYITKHDSELVGMVKICNMVGLDVLIHRERQYRCDECDTKIDKNESTTIDTDYHMCLECYEKDLTNRKVCSNA